VEGRKGNRQRCKVTSTAFFITKLVVQTKKQERRRNVFESTIGQMGQASSIKQKETINRSEDESSRSGDHNQHSDSCVATLRGHTGPVFCVTILRSLAFQIASGSEDQTIRIWYWIKNNNRYGNTHQEEEEEEGQWSCRHVLEGHKESVTSLCHFFASKDGVWDDDCWDTDDDEYTQLPFIGSASLDHTVKVWCLPSTSTTTSSGEGMETSSSNPLQPTCVATLIGHTDHVFVVCSYDNTDGESSFDRHRLISGSQDFTIKMWRRRLKKVGTNKESGGGGEVEGMLQEWECYKTLEGHQDGVRCLLLLPDGNLASGAYDNTVRLWDLGSGQCLRVLSGHNGTRSLLSLSRLSLLCPSFFFFSHHSSNSFLPAPPSATP